MDSDSPAWSLARWLRQAAGADPEPADLGTAFGLDMSLLPAPEAPWDEDASRPPNDWLRRVGLPPG